jgi:hypothetical protein
MPREWRFFLALYTRHGRIVSTNELSDATEIPRSTAPGWVRLLSRRPARSRATW